MICASMAFGVFGLGTVACGSGQGSLSRESGSIVAPLTGTACSADWTAVDTPNLGSEDNVLSSVSGSSPGDVWAVGQYAPEANPNMTLALSIHYDGTSWSLVDTPNVGSHANALLSVAAKGGLAWAVGYRIGESFLARSIIEAWDGTRWQVMAHSQPFETENLYGVAASSTRDVWAVGSGRNGEGAFHTIALHYDGRRWSVVPTVDPGANGNVLYGVVALAPNDAWAVGQKIGEAHPDDALIEHWNGARWTEVSAAVAAAASTQFIGVAARADEVRAVGDAQNDALSLRTFANAGEHRHFSGADTANPSTGDNRLTGVALDGETAIAVGNYLDTDSGSQRTLIVSGAEHSAWAQVPSPNPSDDGDNQLAGISSVGNGELWAVGGFSGPDAAQTLALHRCSP
jgi:hypothetical protein